MKKTSNISRFMKLRTCRTRMDEHNDDIYIYILYILIADKNAEIHISDEDIISKKHK